MTATIGRIVLYCLSKADADHINTKRTDQPRIASRAAENPPQWHRGAQAHIGNRAEAGQVFPMVVVASGTISDMVNGQVHLDGTDVLWATNVLEGDGPGTWAWPQKA